MAFLSIGCPAFEGGFFALYKFPGKVGKFNGKPMINKGKS
jgi:hypothetical protein